MYEAIRTSGKCRWNIYHTSSKCRWSIYRTSRKRRGTLRIVHKVERSSPTVILKYVSQLGFDLYFGILTFLCQAIIFANVESSWVRLHRTIISGNYMNIQMFSFNKCFQKRFQLQKQIQNLYCLQWCCHLGNEESTLEMLVPYIYRVLEHSHHCTCWWPST